MYSLSQLESQLDFLLEINKSTNEQDETQGIVISLEGYWGTGKTYFWNNYIKRIEFTEDEVISLFGKKILNKAQLSNAKNYFSKTIKSISEDTYKENFINVKKHVYISLFGKNSINEVKKVILLKVNEFNKVLNKITEFSGSSKLTGVDVASISNALKIDNFKNIIICFDDFERMSSNLDIVEVLGFISELKESKKCKIILINNNNSIENQDRLNDRIISKELKSSFKVKYRFSTSNNNEIYKQYSEKIIDINLRYAPSLKENFKLVKFDNEYFSEESIFELLENTEINKRFNIRLMKILNNKLNLLKFLNNEEKNLDISNSILLKIFNEVYNIKKEEFNKEINLINIDLLNHHINELLEKHYVNKDEFIDSYNNLVKLKKEEESSNKYLETVRKIYTDYMNSLNLNDSEFVSQMASFIDEHKGNLLSLLAVYELYNYIGILCELDNNNKNKYIESFKKEFIEYAMKLELANDNISLFEEYSYIFEEYPDLKKEIEKNIFKPIESDKIEARDIITIIENFLKNNQNKNDEFRANSILSDTHIKFLINEKDYLIHSIKFIKRINSFTENKPFLETMYRITEAFLELVKDEKYRYRILKVLRQFEIASFREAQIVYFFIKNNFSNIKRDFINSLQNEGINSGIIDKLMNQRSSLDFLHTLYIILDEAKNLNKVEAQSRINAINNFNKKIDFDFDYKTDIYLIDNLYKNRMKLSNYYKF